MISIVIVLSTQLKGTEQSGNKVTMNIFINRRRRAAFKIVRNDKAQ